MEILIRFFILMIVLYLLSVISREIITISYDFFIVFKIISINRFMFSTLTYMLFVAITAMRQTNNNFFN